jgi:hypothetical protein
MSWSDLFIGSGQTSAEADQNYAAQQERLRQQSLARQAAGTATATTERNLELTDESLRSVGAAALIGGLQGSVELVTDPQAWARDMQTGAGMVGSGVGWSFDFGWDTILSFFKKAGWKLWLVVAIVIFVWIGGVPWLLRKTKGSLK